MALSAGCWMLDAGEQIKSTALALICSGRAAEGVGNPACAVRCAGAGLETLEKKY